MKVQEIQSLDWGTVGLKILFNVHAKVGRFCLKNVFTLIKNDH